jgi:hypothetical protein
MRSRLTTRHGQLYAALAPETPLTIARSQVAVLIPYIVRQLGKKGAGTSASNSILLPTQVRQSRQASRSPNLT